MTTERRRGTETRWYEPPPPRDWHPSTAELQRLQSATAYRNALLEPSTTTNRTALEESVFKTIPRGGGGGDIDKYETEKSYLERSGRSSVTSLSSVRREGSSMMASLKDSLDSNLIGSVSSFSRQLPSSNTGSVKDLGATFVFKNKIRSQEDVEKILNTPPSRPRTSTMAKYEPLPAIKHSASGRRGRSMDSNNNKGSLPHPPPLVRSRTYEVIDTKMKNLPVIDDTVSSAPAASSTAVTEAMHNVTINIEGKPITEFLTHAKGGLLKSRPPTRYGRGDETKDGVVSNEISKTDSGDAEKEMESDMLVYIKLPDDSLLLASSPQGQTLGELLEVVGGTRVSGKRLMFSNTGLNDEDKTKTLVELGITNNTTLHLISD